MMMNGNGTGVLGIGNDIVEIDRIRRCIERYREKFLQRVLTHREYVYCMSYRDPAPRVAGRFAVKEAIAKALGCGIGGQLAWLDMEILNDVRGMPYVQFSVEALQRHGPLQMLISISHCKSCATAVALRSVHL